MKKIFTAFLILFSVSTGVFAQADTITYHFSVNVPGFGTVGTTDGKILEGSSFSLAPHTFANYPFIQEAYDAIAGSTFQIPSDFVNENVELSITLKNLNTGAFGYQPLLDYPIFLYFEVAVVGANSGPHGSNSSYVLNNPAILTIPLTQKFLDFVSKSGINIDEGLAVEYYLGTSLSDVGISTEIQHNPDQVVVSISHFSRFGGRGKTRLTDVSETNIAKSFNLSQNYPNPFNPTTNILYSLPKDGYVSLKVYNAIGAEVKTLKSGYQDAGTHEVLLNAENLPSGVYFYTLRFDNITQTKRMILIK